ncbi:hypothetical protein ACFLYB_00590 [Chloroflexota bacterium]
MSRCSNCGRETLRTEDWACQWCGHPLPSGLYKSTEKTYRQLKEERLYRAPEMERTETEPEMEPKQDLQRIKEIELELEPESASRQEIHTPYETKGKVTEAEEEKAEATESEECVKEEIIVQIKAKSAKEPEKEKGTLAEAEIEAAVKIEKETVEQKTPEEDQGEEAKEELEASCEDEEEAEKIEEPRQEAEVEAEQEPPVVELELTVDELFRAYEEDQLAADDKFADKIMRISGSVASIDLKDILDTYYIRLTGTDDDILESVQCMFDKKHGDLLRQLEKGQAIAVQGRYNGSVIAVRIMDCFLVGA